MHYTHAAFLKAQQKLLAAQETTREVTHQIDAIRTEVKDHFFRLADRFNYTYGFDGSAVEDPVERLVDDAEFRYERKGKGILFVNLRAGSVSITDSNGSLRETLRSMKIKNNSKYRDMIEIDIDVASEQLAEVLDLNVARNSHLIAASTPISR